MVALNKASDETINKAYAEYRQLELNVKGVKSEEALGSIKLVCI